MAKGNTLYVVHAGFRTQAYCPIVYETTKESKAYEYVCELEKSNVDYDKIYIEKKPVTKVNKRDMWDD